MIDIAPPMGRPLGLIRSFHLFRRDTGAFSGRSITCESGSADIMAGPEHIAVADVENPHAFRWVDGQLVEDRGEQPSPDHEWNARLGRWWLKPAVEQRNIERAAALAQIETLEKQQARALREHAIGRGGTPAQLKKRLEDIDDQIAALRTKLT